MKLLNREIKNYFLIIYIWYKKLSYDLVRDNNSCFCPIPYHIFCLVK